MKVYSNTTKNKSKAYFLMAPTVALLKKVFGKPLSEVAYASEVISPASRFFHPPAIHDPKELELISGTANTATIYSELSRVDGQYIDHGPSIAYKIKNMLLCDGVFYSSRYRRPVSVDKRSLIKFGNAPLIQGGVLSHCWLGSKYFGHTIHEEIPMAMLAQKRGRAVGIQRPVTQKNEYDQLFSTNVEYLPNIAWISEIEILNDASYSPSKVERWKKMRAVFAKRANRPMHAGVFLMRGMK